MAYQVWLKIKQWLKYLLYAFLAVCVVFTIYTVVRNHQKHEEPAAVEMRYPDTTNTSAVEKALGTGTEESKKVAREIQYIHDGAKVPEVTYYVTAPTVETAAAKVKEQITAQEATAPTAAKEKTDKTVVTVNTAQQKVDVYKINLQKNHKVKVGALAVKDHAYPAIGYQQGRVDVAVATDGRKVKGGYAMYTVTQW